MKGKTVEVILAKNISFCGGVSWAVKKVFELQENESEPIVIFGELIHNRQFDRELARRNIETAEFLEQCKNKTAVIRSHGLPPETEEVLRKTARRVVDLTCPNVKKVQQMVKRYSDEGYEILITGSENHPEVAGLRGYARHSTVIETLNQAKEVALLPKTVLISQTTFSENLFLSMAEILKNRLPEICIENTLCAATRIRQKEVEELSIRCSLVVIVGGRHSSNTRKLLETAQKSGAKKVILVETAEELNPEDFKGEPLAGIASGASTPLWVIEEVVRRIQTFEI